MKPVEILEKGLSKLQNQICDQKAHLQACLQAGQSISDRDEEWLDHNGNLVDEEQLVDDLDNTSDYDQRLKGLSSSEKSIIDKLTSLAKGSERVLPLQRSTSVHSSSL